METARPDLATALSHAVAGALDEAAPVRLHVDWSPTGAMVWIGLDAGAAPNLPGLVDALSRWMARNGLRLRSVVCNGVPWPGDGTSTQTDGSAPQPLTDVDVFVEKEI